MFIHLFQIVQHQPVKYEIYPLSPLSRHRLSKSASLKFILAMKNLNFFHNVLTNMSKSVLTKFVPKVRNWHEIPPQSPTLTFLYLPYKIMCTGHAYCWAFIFVQNIIFNSFKANHVLQFYKPYRTIILFFNKGIFEDY